MNPAAIICKKRDREALSQAEITDFIDGFAAGEIPDYQMSALAMAILLNGMSDEETTWLTEAMLRSGTVLEWSAGPPLVDKHSTGGVGDKVSLILAPLLACCDCRVPMISGRGLGPTGGTLDKLESIPGFRTDLNSDEMQRIVDEVGCVICGASDEIAPADRALYALRDVTGTVPSIPLITASILSKKLAEGLDALVLDVKVGSGAFMKTEQAASKLSSTLVSVGRRLGLATEAVITDMNQPLGRMIGNAVEVDEAISVLEGAGPEDLKRVTLMLGAQLLESVSRASSREQALQILTGHLGSGAAREKFSAMVTAQGGTLTKKRPVASAQELTAQRGGYVARIDTEAIGMAITEMGGGRRQKTDVVDHSVGIEFCCKLSDKVTIGDTLLTCFCDANTFQRLQPTLDDAIELVTSPDELETASADVDSGEANE